MSKKRWLRRKFGRWVQRPFKGSWYYEWQIGPFVLQWLHDLDHHPCMQRGVWIYHFRIWWDSIWWRYEVARHFDPAVNWLKRVWAWIDEEWWFLRTR